MGLGCRCMDGCVCLRAFWDTVSMMNVRGLGGRGTSMLLLWGRLRCFHIRQMCTLEMRFHRVASAGWIERLEHLGAAHRRHHSCPLVGRWCLIGSSY
jgi:hypothetical protein